MTDKESQQGVAAVAKDAQITPELRMTTQRAVLTNAMIKMTLSRLSSLPRLASVKDAQMAKLLILSDVTAFQDLNVDVTKNINQIRTNAKSAMTNNSLATMIMENRISSVHQQYKGAMQLVSYNLVKPNAMHA